MSHDVMGDRMKGYEAAEAQRRFMPLLPVCVRLDGKNFSTWTRGLPRPFCKELHDCMVNTTMELCREFNANIGYTQSDEISLLFYCVGAAEMPFGGRVQKIVSTLAAWCTAVFNQQVPRLLPDHAVRLATFDCRAWQVPTLEEAANVILWREFDATKNSVQQAAQCHYSHVELLNRHTGEQQEMLFQKGINWNDYPDWFKRGTYVIRSRVNHPYSVDELVVLPERHAARQNPDLQIERWQVKAKILPRLASIQNRMECLLFGAEPIIDSAPTS